ncbi:M28 family peptidase [Roseivirga sp. UBA838]|uniref:M28 family peptidase n=1 Tax=Roseivirga sp. UBA838 TaxID=1947393 RepID=UPI00257CAF1D|nr:M28 family peptidase [Roseivirga sp. UBA838]
MKKRHLTLMLGACMLSLGACAQKTDLEKTLETVSQQTIKDHIYYLASDEMRGRDTGSEEILKAADYLAKQFETYGAKPVPGADGYFQPVPLRMKTPATSASLEFSNKSFELNKDFLIVDGQSAEVEGEVVYLNYAFEEDYTNADVKGKIVFAKAGDGKVSSRQEILRLSREKYEIARANGALGLVEFYSSPSTPWEQLGFLFNRVNISLDSFEDKAEIIPHLWLKDLDNANQRFMMTKSIKRASIGIEGMKNELTKDKNVVAMVEGTDPELKDEYIMFSAHYDHVGVGRPNEEGDSIYNGTRDNAIGTVTVLSAAENIARYPMKRSALFVLFTAEEKGLVGSRYLANNPIIPNEQIVFCWNSDNGGYNDTTISTIIGLERTTAAQYIKDANVAFGLTAIDDPAGEQGLFDRSDNVSFARKGIPAPTYSLGFRAFDAEIMKYYHQPGDNPNTVDYDYLEKFFKSYVYASRLIGNAAETPFWLPGDKYYETGLELYGRDN